MALSRHRFAMSCCAEARAQVAAPSADGLPQSLADLVEANGERLSLTLHVPGIHCAGCIGKIEAAVAAQGDGVTGRVNFTRRTITLAWRAQKGSPAAAISALRNLGYTLEPIPREASGADPQGRELMRALAVSGFAAMNVMLLSVSVWAGADGATATFLNWFAALVALPALGYAARPFLRSALTALKNRTLNMDVPISLAIVLAGALSLAHTISGEGETYFDAAITLTFFLLAGRYLDHLARERARTSVRQLATLTPLTAHLFRSGGRTVPVPVDTIVEGDRIHLAAGERLAVDGILEAPATFDLALATGESRPVDAAAGEEVLAGALALTGPVTVQAVRPAADSFIARLAALQHAAESARSRPARIADRAAQLYAPLVHGLAALTFIGWMVTGASAGHALTIAIAVLIITCPCALGLAVPAVHVAACDRLFRRGLVIKDGGVLERLRTLDTAIFDKTGTLTTPELDPSAPVPDAALAEAAALARHSTHPISRAVVRAAEARALSIPAAQDIQEVPGRGVSGTVNGDRIFLGMATKGEGLTVEREGEQATPLVVKESLRPGAAELVQQLSSRGVAVSILSGDRPAAVGAVAQKLGVSDWRGGASAHDKIAHCVALQKNGARVLMVGDGFNDGPALSAADVSMAPAEASDLSRAAADIVLTGHDLSDAYDALNTARRAHRLILQNFMIAAGYNSVAIPLAVLGYATPLLAALAMSTSSILVTLNALRLTERRHTATASPLPAAVASPNTAPSPNTGASPNTVRRPSTVSLSPLAQTPSQGAAPT